MKNWDIISTFQSKMSENGDCTWSMINTVKQYNPYSALHYCVYEIIHPYNEWAEWSECTVSCNSGVKTRRRECSGSNCVGQNRETRLCNTQLCPMSMSLIPDCFCPQNDEGIPTWQCYSDDCDTKTERCELFDYKNMIYKCKPKVLGECIAWGDPHLITFDQQNIDVYGVGDYIFSTSESIPQVLPFYMIRMITDPWGAYSVVGTGILEFRSPDDTTTYKITFGPERGTISINDGVDNALITQKNNHFSFQRTAQV